jgi:hypothetical protein
LSTTAFLTTRGPPKWKIEKKKQPSLINGSVKHDPKQLSLRLATNYYYNGHRRPRPRIVLRAHDHVHAARAAAKGFTRTYSPVLRATGGVCVLGVITRTHALLSVNELRVLYLYYRRRRRENVV